MTSGQVRLPDRAAGMHANRERTWSARAEREETPVEKQRPDASGPGDLGRRVARRRAELGLSQRDVADRAGMASSYLDYLETSPAQPTNATVLRLAQVLETTPDALLGGGADAPPGRTGPARQPVLEHLDWDECLRLVTPGGVGRVAFATESGPLVLPVNFTVDEGAIVFRVAPNSPQADHAAAEMAFEVDKLDEAMSQGWSVLIVGHAAKVTDPGELRRLEEGGRVRPWAGNGRDVYLRLAPERVTGRRIRTQ